MNKKLFLILFVLIVIILCSYDSISNKNKFRLNLLFDGFINKLILILIIVVVMMESIQLGIILMFTFFTILLSLNMDNKNIIEGFTDYYSDK